MDNFGEDSFWSDDTQLHALAQLGAHSAALLHDANNLLQVALGNLELIALQPLEDATRKRLSRANASLVKCARMMRAGRTGAGEAVGVYVARFIAENIETFRDVGGPGITLDWEDRSKGAVIRADERRLESALINLLVNARDAMNGVGHVSIVCRLICSDRHQALQLGVVDDGPGIPREIQAAVFNRFFTTKSGGSGLGLSSVRRFVDDSGGTVRLESRAGLGTSVSMFFPVLPDASTRPLRNDRGLRSLPSSEVIVSERNEPALRHVESPPTGFHSPEPHKKVLE